MNLVLGFIAVPVTLAGAVADRAETDQARVRLRVGIVQMALGATIQENRDRILAAISQVADAGARVAVFPESALRGNDSDNPALVEDAVAAIRRAARERNVYVMFGGATYSPKAQKEANWMSVIGPDGSEVFRYDKLYDRHNAKMPGVFFIDGIPSSAMICADRWLRGVEEIPIQQGAKVSFELSCNFASEWIPAYEWYWYVPRALRNGVWVIFANTGNKVAGAPDDPSAPDELRHGHSAVIAPDGRIIAAARDDAATCIIAELDIDKAARAEAQARAAHPALQRFWQAGLRLHGGQAVEAPAWTPILSTETDITIAAAQVVDDLPEMEAMIGQARAKNADLVVFPERAIHERALERLQRAAGKHAITVVVGMEHRVAGSLRNSAFVLGPDGSVLTRYDQLSATAPHQRGSEPASMWFRVKGVPAVVTIGRDALWTELAELAAVAGAQIHVHLERDANNDHDADLRRLQVWSNLASYRTFSATVNVTGSTIWDDRRGPDEARAEVRGLTRLEQSRVEVYSPFSANVVVRAKPGKQLIAATRRIGGANLYHPRSTSHLNPQMDAWYRIGAEIIAGKVAEGRVTTTNVGHSTQGKPYQEGRFQGRIAYSADGNHNDADDWAASSMALAIIAEAGLRERLVHFDYNCILPLTNPTWEREHAHSVLGAAERYGFDRSKFFDCRKNLDQALDSIARAINDSAEENPLYFILAGPMEVPFRGIQRANPEKRKFVYCISHSRWNDGFDSRYDFRFTKRSVIEQDVQWVQIRDQNRLLSRSPYGRPAQPEEFADYFWMRDSRDSNLRFLWERMIASTRPDPSDAGMTYFLIRGDEECDPAKLKRLIDDRDRTLPISARNAVRIEAENFRHLEGFVLDNRNDRDASHRLNVKLSRETSGCIRTRFDEPFARSTGQYDVVVRYLDANGSRCRFSCLVNGIACGSAWESTGEGRGWLSQTIPGVAIQLGDEIQLHADGPDARLDYVQLNWLRAAESPLDLAK